LHPIDDEPVHTIHIPVIEGGERLRISLTSAVDELDDLDLAYGTPVLWGTGVGNRFEGSAHTTVLDRVGFGDLRVNRLKCHVTPAGSDPGLSG